MELTIALTILNAVICVSNFVLGRKDKAIKNTKEDLKEDLKDKTEQKLIDYRLEQVEKKLDKVLDILDSYDKEIDVRVEKALENHIKIYHNKGQ